MPRAPTPPLDWTNANGQVRVQSGERFVSSHSNGSPDLGERQPSLDGAFVNPFPFSQPMDGACQSTFGESAELACLLLNAKAGSAS